MITLNKGEMIVFEDDVVTTAPLDSVKDTRKMLVERGAQGIFDIEFYHRTMDTEWRRLHQPVEIPEKIDVIRVQQYTKDNAICVVSLVPHEKRPEQKKPEPAKTRLLGAKDSEEVKETEETKLEKPKKTGAPSVPKIPKTPKTALKTKPKSKSDSELVESAPESAPEEKTEVPSTKAMPKPKIAPAIREEEPGDTAKPKLKVPKVPKAPKKV